ncbi:MAG TPA: hypothetical protein VFN35_12210 [Ktedonobacteraceae bacterium]|nr:hypothetical protein [Ktedonobacteraceae bacterium]
MQQDHTTDRGDTQEPTHVTLLTVQREVGITRVILRKYPMYLGIEPICFHIGTRSLSLSRRQMALVAQLKQKPALLAYLPSGDATRAARDGAERKEI